MPLSATGLSAPISVPGCGGLKANKGQIKALDLQMVTSGNPEADPAAKEKESVL